MIASQPQVIVSPATPSSPAATIRRRRMNSGGSSHAIAQRLRGQYHPCARTRSAAPDTRHASPRAAGRQLRHLQQSLGATSRRGLAPPRYVPCDIALAQFVDWFDALSPPLYY
ncbi:hypothetical protein GCM10020219_083000 [Nonomuraea dietziae]